MYGGGQMRLVLVFSVVCAVFYLATATTCTSQSKSQDGREACYLYLASFPGPLREFRTASDERAGPGNEANLHHMVQSVDFGGQDKQTMNGVAMETPSDVAVALATKHANMSWLSSFFKLVTRVIGTTPLGILTAYMQVYLKL